MRTYVITLRHDKGKVKLHVVTNCLQKAIKLACAAEMCPPSSIKKIKVV